MYQAQEDRKSNARGTTAPSANPVGIPVNANIRSGGLQYPTDYHMNAQQGQDLSISGDDFSMMYSSTAPAVLSRNSSGGLNNTLLPISEIDPQILTVAYQDDEDMLPTGGLPRRDSDMNLFGSGEILFPGDGMEDEDMGSVEIIEGPRSGSKQANQKSKKQQVQSQDIFAQVKEERQRGDTVFQMNDLGNVTGSMGSAFSASSQQRISSASHRPIANAVPIPRRRSELQPLAMSPAGQMSLPNQSPISVSGSFDGNSKPWIGSPFGGGYLPPGGQASSVQFPINYMQFADPSMNNTSVLDPSSLTERKKKRRESHNAVERRRRDNINDRITELSTLLPHGNEIIPSAVAVENMKLSKGQVLKKTAGYIRYMQDLVKKQARLLQSVDPNYRINPPNLEAPATTPGSPAEDPGTPASEF